MYVLIELGSFPRRVTYRTPYEAHLDGFETVQVGEESPQVNWLQLADGTFFDPYAPVPEEHGEEPPVE